MNHSAKKLGKADESGPSGLSDISGVKDDINVFASFKCSEPDKQNHLLHLRQPRKIVVKEPSNGQDVQFSSHGPRFMEKYFYFTVSSLKGTKIHISLNLN
mmetsp:Transcript_30342/g.46438  ORF Transcript_30342/g.46438 Transcript_30342/m.46438 type:complete len:100 (+) Transcript_30342:1700-1999(+)